MNTTVLFVIANLASLISVVFAFLLAKNGSDGWGWFLFIAVCLATSLKLKDS